MKAKQILVLLILVAGIGLFITFDLGQYLQLSSVRSQMDQLLELYERSPLLVAGLYAGIYIAVTALSLPGAAVMTLVGGALFGFSLGLLLVSFASTIGATLAFLVSRTLLRDWVQQRFSKQLQSVNEGFSREGAFYLFGLRLVPLFPFFMINLLMGLLPVPTWRFYWVSQLGMLAGTAVYVNAGTQLAELEGLAGILSPQLLASFVLLGIFPLVAKRLLNRLIAKRRLSAYKKPKYFDTNLLVIGAGSAGLVSSLIASAVKARVTLVERDKMGGDCLNTGCVPSKALIRSGRIADYMRRAESFGLKQVDVAVNFASVMRRVHRAIATIEPHDSVERYSSLGVDCVSGNAKIISPYEVEVDGRTISARNIVLASGARPVVPDISGIENIDYLTSETLWQIEDCPQRLLVLGGGPIGCELAQAFARLGSDVSIVGRANQLMPREDEDVSAYVASVFESEGINVYTGHQPVCFRTESGQHWLDMEKRGDSDHQIVSIAFDQLLVAVGRKANVENMGLEELGVGLTEQGTVRVNEYLQTDVPTIYACGDVAGPYQFTHMASHQAWYASVNALFGGFKRFKVDYSIVPWATFTDPEVARVGLSEIEATEQGVAYEVTRYGLDDLDRAIADGEARGFIKALTKPGSDRILGVTIVGYHAAEMIAEYVLAMKHGLGLGKVMSTIHIYPTLNEANKFVAGEWRKARKPEKLLAWVEKYHRWLRG